MTKMEVTLETLKEETKICLDSMSNHRLFIQTSNLEFLFLKSANCFNMQA